MSILRLVALAFFLTLILAAQVAEAAPVFTLVHSEVAVPAGRSEINARLILSVKDLSASELANDKLVPTLRDVSEASASPPTVSFKQPFPLDPSATERSWVLPMTINGIPPDTAQDRYVNIKVGDVAKNLMYRLRSGVAPAGWRIDPAPAPSRSLEGNWVVPINIVIPRHSAVTDLRLKQSELLREKTEEPLAKSNLVICPSPMACDGAPVPLSPPGGTVWLTRHSNATDHVTWPGKYTGNVTLASIELPDGATVPLTINITTWYWQLAGTLAIVLGVLSALAFTNVLQHRLRRMDLLGPAVELRASVDALRSRLRTLQSAPPCPAIKQQLDTIDQALDDVELERHGLPPLVPKFIHAMKSDGNALVDHLNAQRLALQVIWILVDEGLETLFDQLLAFEKKYGPPSNPDAFDNAWRAVDRIAGSAPLPNAVDARSLIKDEVARLEAALTAMRPSSTAEAAFPSLGISGTARHRSPRNPAELDIALKRYSRWAWILLFFITVVAGYYLLILDKPAFGTARDLFDCLLWGLGLPAGAAAASTTVSSLSTTYRGTA